MKRLIFCADAGRLAELAGLLAVLGEAPTLLHHTAEEALAAAAEHPLELALVDALAGEDEALRLIRALREKSPQTSLLLVCDSEQRELRSRTLDLSPIDFLTWPIEPFEFRTRVSTLAGLARATYRVQRLEFQLQGALEGIEEVRQTADAELLSCLLRAATYRDDETGRHLVRIGHYSKLIGMNMGLSDADVELLLKAAPMHDVGKLALPDIAMHSSAGASDDVLDILKLHTLRGHDILKLGDSELLRAAAEIALSHHERHDGSGYPHGLVGLDIPLYARIVAVADAFDALAFDPLVGEGEAVEQAKSYLRRNAGTHFDPQCVQAFLLDEAELASILELVA